MNQYSHEAYSRLTCLSPCFHLRLQYWANVEARVFRFQDDIPNDFDPPALTDQALLQRVPEEEEFDILGRVAFDQKRAEAQ